MDWNPGRKYRALLSQIQDILEDGEQRTVRDVYYALESRGHEWEYRQVKRAVKKGRRAGFLAPGQIVDASRRAEYQRNEGFNGIPVEEYVSNRLDGIASGYHEDLWREQSDYVEVWVEKQSLASVFKPICRRLNVRLEAWRGDWSDSKIHETASRLNTGPLDRGQDVTVLYFGDYNPSGYHAPVVAQNTMGHYGIDLGRDGVGAEDPRYFDIAPEGRLHLADSDGESSGSILFKRVALTTEQINRFDLPTNPAPSKSDKDKTVRDSFMRYVTGGEDVNVELNALKEFHRDYLEELIEEAITEYIDEDTREKVESRVSRRREKIREMVDLDRGQDA